MADPTNEAWQQAIRDLDVPAITELLSTDPTLFNQGIVHTRSNGTTFDVMPLEMVNKSLEATKILVNAGADPNQANPQGHALPLHNSSRDVAEFLIEHGADVNKIGYEECTPLMYEVYMKNHELVRLFIERGSDVNYQRQLDGFSSLHFAAQKRDTEMIGMLLAAGADRSLKNDENHTPLDIATANGATEIISQLEQSAG